MANVGVAPPALEATDAASPAGSTDVKMQDSAQEGNFTWTIRDFSKIRNKMHYSDPFEVGTYQWRVLMFPKGNNADFLSLYLDVFNPGELPYGWSRYASFKLTLLSHHDSKLHLVKDASHNFNSRESDWGFTQFVTFQELNDPRKGYVIDDTLTIEASVSVKPQENYFTYDSKKETGWVGLKNQGATCYMNSLLQTLFHIPYFRKAVYEMPTAEEDVSSKNIPLALQSLFYKVQFNDSSVSTKDLTRSFGWDANESFMQHDVQELNRVLCEKLEEKMKSTVVEGTIQHLFEGKVMNFIECKDVDYKSTNHEVYQDLQLDVKGFANIYESFDKYVEVEELNGDNKYRAEGHGLQDARKGVLFENFPPVLELQLKRFEYNFQTDMMVKINDRYEFPLELDLDKDNRRYLTKDSDKSIRNLYHLHSVLVHSGGVHGGHYYAFIRPDLKDQWYKFDDERVTKEEPKNAVDEQFGGEDDSVIPALNNETRYKYAKHSNAYMLVYVRADAADRIVCPVGQDNIAPHLLMRFKKEQEDKERKKKEKAEAHLYTMVRVARDADMASQIGSETFFDLIDHDKVHTLRVQKQTKFADLKLLVEKELGVPAHMQRYWLWAKRQNHTYRPSRHLTPQEDSLTLVQIKDFTMHQQQQKNNIMDLKLYLEEYPPEIPAPPPINKGDILLFFKLYDPTAGTLRYVGKLFANVQTRVMDMRDEINALAGFPATEELQLFEEIKFEPNVMCEPIDRKATLRSCQLEDGDILCFQLAAQAPSPTPPAYPTVPEFLDYVRHRQLVRFCKLENPKEAALTLELSKQHTYTDITHRLAAALDLQDPSLLRLTAHNNYSHNPRPQPFKFNTAERLADMLVHVHQTTDILYFEVLDIPLPELEQLKILKVSYHNAKTEHVCDELVRLPRDSCVADLLERLQDKLSVDHSAQGELRLLEVCYNRIYKVFQPGDKIDCINDQYWTLRVEEVPEEERQLSPTDRLINVHHFRQDAAHNTVVHNFGEPFFLRIGEKETLGQIKTRIQAKLGTADEEFAKWKFSFCSLGRPEALTDDEVVIERFQHTRRDWGGQWEYYLGLEHEDKGRRRAPHYGNRLSTEKAVKIWN